ncbi:MAG: glycosyltransferase family 4 protein [Nocardioidaceae bacterium]|nr:glycosyltransferase family 4 protein [Nocardioidaceae bacterium]
MSRRLRIAMIASSRFPVSEPFAGGLEAHLWAASRELARRGHRVSLFAAPGSDAAVGVDTLQVDPLELTVAATQDASMVEMGWLQEHHAYLDLMVRLAGPLASSFDVVHNHSLHHLPVAMARTIPMPMLTTLHTPPTPWLESAIRVARGAGGRFVAVSAHTAASWQHTGQVPVLLNGIDVSRWPQGPGGTRLVWSGRMVAEKAPHLAIQAARLAGLPLDLAGPVSDPAYFDECVRPLLGDDVRHLGHLDHAQLAAVVGRSAATLVTPDWDEPYGLVVAESLACGTPVVAFARGGVGEVLDASCGRLVPAGDVQAMAAAVADVTALDRDAARRRAETACSIDRMTDLYEDAYADMLELAA